MKLYADAAFAKFIADRGLAWLYDGGIDTQTLQKLPDNIDYKVFWAAAKIFAYEQTPAPAAFIDVDAILWNPLPDWSQCDLMFLHTERVNRNDPRRLNTPPDYQTPGYPWDGEEFNTAFVLFNDDDLRREYTAEAIRFMAGNPATGEHWQHICFAEQSLLAQCAKHRKARFKPLLSAPPTDERIVTHLWGTKQKLRENPVRARAYVNRCISRLESDFPSCLPQLRPLIDWARSEAEQQITQRPGAKPGNAGAVGELFRRPPTQPIFGRRAIA